MTTPTKKPFEKRYKTVVPVKRPADVEPLTELGAVDEHPDYTMARWLGRESFENTVADDRLDLVEYAERLVPLDEVDPRLADMLGAPVEEFEWFEFSGLGRLNQDMFDWHSAEFVWRCEEWLAAERAYLTARDNELQADNAGGA
ncbi:minor tail protein [Mycobacterium phage Sneeze]|uniref:Minor tail protein n=1 Tax=Mycobacterium phage Rabbs TaxID=2530143 RepID=A0A481VSB4_9CAUD|nr:minor tail protein [Mycobacterium phage Sneeze]YP_010051366.1 minor tail protein [Mycobacterium phage Rabbs]ANU79735.1 minor tail protein [Mycobacterium phage Sneeze]QBI96774.1 minor tail protein [Mycobacterium phage Rabbs]